VDIAIQLVGDIAPGGLLDQSLNTLAVTAEATNIPSGFEVSIEGLEIGQSIHAGQVTLPTGVELAGDPEQVLLHVVAAPTAAEMEAEGAGEAEGEAAAGETAEAGAAESDAGGGEAAAAPAEEPAAE
jgi:large subunit ribosomal protein L25